ncbi:hypothetical protein PFISCL1PPCAC_16577, partial [Pristionchus fissidentatus]
SLFRRMSRSTRSSTRLPATEPLPEVKSVVQSQPTADAIIVSATEKITKLITAFVDEATAAQSEISADKSLLLHCNTVLRSVADKDGVEKLYARINESNNTYKSTKMLQEATNEWQKLVKKIPPSSLCKLTGKKRRLLCDAGRDVASSLILTGNTYAGLNILREVVDINDYDPCTASILLRWLVRNCEWEAIESLLKADKEKKKSNFMECEDLLAVCQDIVTFHRSPNVAAKETRTTKFLEIVDEMNKQEKSFQIYESQIILYTVLFIATRTGIRTSNMLDPLYCIDQAMQKAEAVLSNRWQGVIFDKPMETLKSKTDDSLGYLKCAAAVGEYYEVTRMAINEYVRCCLLREAIQFASISLCASTKLGFPVWTTQSLCQFMSIKLRSVPIKDDTVSFKYIVPMLFRKEDDGKKKKEETANCVTQITDRLKDLLPLSECVHMPSPSTSSCGCYLCVEYSFNPTFAFFCAKLALLHEEYSAGTISSLVDSLTEIRARFAPFQEKLMGKKGKPRPPSWMCDEACQCIISFLLSPNGLSMERGDAKRKNLIAVTDKMCSYSTQLCLPYRLVLRVLTRRPRLTPLHPWMITRSKMSALADISWGSTGRGSKAGTPSRGVGTPSRGTPSRSPFTPITLNTPIRKLSQKEAATEMDKKEEEDEKNDYLAHGHLLYHDWRSRLCEQLSLSSTEPWEKAMYLSETVAVATRQGRRLVTGQMRPCGFSRVEEFTNVVKTIPIDMTVNQLIVSMSGDLYLVKVHATRSPIIIPLARESKWTPIVGAFNRVIKKSEESAQAGRTMTDAKKYWEGRRKAEELMRRAMVDMESDLLGPFAPLLLPSKQLTKTGESVAASLCRYGTGGMRKEMAREMVSLATQIKEEKYKQLVECMAHVEGWNKEQVDELLGLKKGLEKEESNRWIVDTKDRPFVFFVLSTELSHIPWEAVSLLDNAAHCSRLVSIHQLVSLLHSFEKVPHSANPTSAFYILDPANDLEKTTERLTPVVEKLPWKGVVGRAPDRHDTASLITNNDFLIFLGHGDGLRYISRSIVRKTKCKAVVLLMGCSSVHTVHEGRGMDGKGAVLDYSVASCPCIVGCLYLVTDGEIDKYFTALVDEGLARHLNKEDPSPSSQLRLHLEAMSRARGAVKLKYLTGAAVVSYGIPIDIRVEDD